jgi:hypothetical protein
MTQNIEHTETKITMRTLNTLLKQQGQSENTEVTRYKGEYWLLHICKNGVPVPLYHSKDIAEIKSQIDKEA